MSEVKCFENVQHVLVYSVQKSTKVVYVERWIRKTNHWTPLQTLCILRLGTRKAAFHDFRMEREKCLMYSKLGIFSLQNDTPVVEPESWTTFDEVHRHIRRHCIGRSSSFCRWRVWWHWLGYLIDVKSEQKCVVQVQPACCFSAQRKFLFFQWWAYIILKDDVVFPATSRRRLDRNLTATLDQSSM